MSFRTQRLQNRFPHYTKIRNDSSSLGARFLSAISQEVEELEIDNLLTARAFNIDTFTPMPNSYLYYLPLDYIERISDGNAYNFDYPTITGTVDGSPQVLERAETVADFYSQLPSSLSIDDSYSYTDLYIYDSSDEVINEIEKMDRYWIVLAGSPDFSQENSLDEISEPRPAICLYSFFDANYYFTKSSQTISDVGNYPLPIMNELIDFKYQGFTGDVKIVRYISDLIQESTFRDYTVDDVSSKLWFKVEDDQLIFYVKSFDLGEDYRDDSGSSISFIEGAVIELYDDNDIPISDVIGVVESLVDGRFLVLTSTHVHFYNLVLPEINPLPTSTFIEPLFLENSNNYVELNDYAYLWLRLKTNPGKIDWWTISVNDAQDNVFYLQADKTWDVSEYKFHPDTVNSAKKIIETRYKYLCEYVGQYDFTVNVGIGLNTYQSCTSSIVPHLEAVKSLEHDIVDPTGISIDWLGRLTIFTASTVYKMSQHKIKCFIDGKNSIAYTLEDLDIVES